MHDDSLYLDPAIQTRILIPLCITVLSFGVIRHYLAKWSKSPTTLSTDQAEQERTLLRVKQLMSAQISKDEYMKEYNALTNPADGALRKRFSTNPLDKLLDPNAMHETMKQNVISVLPNIAMMSFVSYCYPGVIIARLPFSLPECFRPLLLRGIEIDTIPVSYVTSMSMYFILLFAQRGLVNLLVGETSQNDLTMGLPKELLTGGADPQKLYQNALQELEMHKAMYEDGNASSSSKELGIDVDATPKIADTSEEASTSLPKPVPSHVLHEVYRTVDCDGKDYVVKLGEVKHAITAHAGDGPTPSNPGRNNRIIPIHEPTKAEFEMLRRHAAEIRSNLDVARYAKDSITAGEKKITPKRKNASDEAKALYSHVDGDFVYEYFE